MMETISNYKSSDIVFSHTIETEPTDTKYNFHTHDICEMIFIKSGNISAIIDSKEYKLFDNSLIIFRPNIIHRIKITDGSKPYERCAVLFDEKLIASSPFKMLDKNLHVINCNKGYIGGIFEKLDYYIKMLSKEDFKVVLKNSIEEIIYNLTLIESDEIEISYNVINPVINNAIEFIEKNYKSQITIDDICKELFISKCHLHHLFTEILTTSPKKYINVKRLTEARKLIRQGYKPYDIYSVCGFTDYGTFYRNYRSHFGHIPSKENEFEIERTFKS